MPRPDETIEQAAARSVFEERFNAMLRCFASAAERAECAVGDGRERCFFDRGVTDAEIAKVEAAIAKFREAKAYYQKVGR